MSLEKEINDGIKAAMLAKEKVRLAGLRAVKAEDPAGQNGRWIGRNQRRRRAENYSEAGKTAQGVGRRLYAEQPTGTGRKRIGRGGRAGSVYAETIERRRTGDRPESDYRAGGSRFAGGYGKGDGSGHQTGLPGRPTAARFPRRSKNYCSSAHSVINRSNGVGMSVKGIPTFVSYPCGIV